MKQDYRAELHRVAERMLKAGTTARRKVGDIAHEAIREWGEIWHRVLGEHGKRNGHGAEPTHDEIAARAYTIWVSNGCPPNTADEDWARAERELHGR
jgi:alkylated DNA nucleotide flippase Atl1